MPGSESIPRLIEAWSLGIGWIGRGSIVLAFLALAVSAVLGSRGTSHERLSQKLFSVGCWAFFGALAAILALFTTDQFHFKYVFDHGAADHELKYKIAGVWSGQEGSFLLWACTSAIFGLAAAGRTGPYRRWFTVVYAAFLACVAGILWYETPFALIDGAIAGARMPDTGRGMPPSLLNYWVTIHPPTIFLGFGSLTVLYAWAMSAMATRDLTSWAPMVRPWAIVSLTLLGLGLCMGGFWAYETLGWGGFWAWDPVENTSFVPWCAVAALVHGLFVQITKGKWAWANIGFAAVPFLLFCYGTFLTRSGFLGDTSVHSFAEMNRSALWILVGIGALAILVFLATWIRTGLRLAKEAKSAESKAQGTFLNRQNAYGGAITLLLAFGLSTAIGMSVPLIVSLQGRQPFVVEEGIYHQVLSWFFLPLLLLLAIGPWLGWKGERPMQVVARLSNALAVAIFLTGIILLWLKRAPWGVAADFNSTVTFPAGKVLAVPWVLFLTFLCLFAAVSNLARIGSYWKRARPSVGGLVIHFGLALTLLGLVFSRGFEQKAVVVVHPSKPVEAFGYTLTFVGPTARFNERQNKVAVKVTDPRGAEFTALPGLYFTPGAEGEPSPVIWPHIERRPLYDLYLTLHPMVFDATGETPMKVGESRLYEGILLTYKGLRTEGQTGMIGAKFIADVTIATPEGTSQVAPSLRIGEQGLESEPARMSEDFNLVLDRIDAADKSATLKIEYIQPAFPVEVFYKPLTLFVWLGVGIMTLGGLMAARYRGTQPRKPQGAADERDRAETESRNQDAPEPVA